MVSVAENLTSIANSIRAKTGTTDTMKLEEMPALIDRIETGGGGTLDGLEGIDGITSVTMDLTTNPTSYASITVGLTNIPTSCFQGIKNIKEVKLPYVEKIEGNIIASSDVEVLDIGPALLSTRANSLVSAPALKTLILRCFFSNSISLAGSPIYNGEGYIYVPDEYVEKYKTSSKWERYVDQIKPLSDIEPVKADTLCIKSTAISARTLAGEIYAAPPNDGVAIKKVVLPNVTYFDGNIFDTTSKIEVLDVGSSETNITLFGYTFAENPVLTTLIFRGWMDTTAGASRELANTPIIEGNGYLYVPDDLLEQYKTSTAWSSIASQIKPISEL